MSEGGAQTLLRMPVRSWGAWRAHSWYAAVPSPASVLTAPDEMVIWRKRSLPGSLKYIVEPSGLKHMYHGLLKLALLPVPSAYDAVPEPASVVTAPVPTAISRMR